MVIRAKATDGDNDKLTYTLTWSNDINLGSAQTVTANGNAGADVTFERTGLNRGTTYYYRIDVSDGITTTTGQVKSAATTGNSNPVINNVNGTVSDITTITVKATATDANGDELTYKLYWGTAQNSLSEVETKTGNSGSQITFAARTNLGNYTTYYWRVDVTDGYGMTTGSVNSTRTWCKITACTGTPERGYSCWSKGWIGKIDEVAFNGDGGSRGDHLAKEEDVIVEPYITKTEELCDLCRSWIESGETVRKVYVVDFACENCRIR